MSVAECGDQLRRRFPSLFAGAMKPLKLRIQADIQQRAPGVFGRRVLSAFFSRHTGSTPYLVSMTKSAHRFDLDGQPAGELSEEHRQAAAEELARRRTNHQAKVDQAEEARRHRAALLRDFERTTLTPANFCALKGVTPETLDALLATARREAEERARLGPPAGAPPRGEREGRGERRPPPRRDRRERS
jgi:sRNA-binding protein